MNNDTYQIITDRIIEKLSAGVIPWKHFSTLRADESAPRNYLSERPYNGVNYFLLSMMQYRSPYWLTFKQAKSLGGNVRKGEKSTPIVFWSFTDVKDPDSRPGEISSRDKRHAFLKRFNVFNQEQVDGIELKAMPETPSGRDTSPNDTADAVIHSMHNAPTIDYVDSPSAFYRPSTDTIQMTNKQHCVNDDRFYEVLFHELTHSTGHKKRLARDGVGNSHAFGSREYGREELIAEMGAAFLCAECGISQGTIDDSSAYIDNWLKLFRSDTKILIQAAGKAQKACDFILGRKYRGNVE